QIVRDPRVLISQAEASDAPPISDPASPEFRKLSRVVKEVFAGAVVIPILTPGTTDSRHYSRISKNIYRFSPMVLTRDDLNLLHGGDERISLENCQRVLQFYVQLSRQTTQNGN